MHPIRRVIRLTAFSLASTASLTCLGDSTGPTNPLGSGRTASVSIAGPSSVRQGDVVSYSAQVTDTSGAVVADAQLNWVVEPASGGFFASDGRFIYSVLDQKPKRAALTRLRRVQNIPANPQVSLVVDHYDEDWSHLWYVLVSGRADLLLEGDERIAAIVLLRAKYQQYREMDIDLNPVIRITPDRVVSWGIDLPT